MSRLRRSVLWRDSYPGLTQVAGGVQNFLANPAEASPSGYEIVQSAVHATRHGKEAHTFLLDKKTGAVWQMICQPKSDVVEFQRVRRIGLDEKSGEAEQ